MNTSIPRYSALSFWQIKSLPVSSLMAAGGLVVVWVTNKQKYVKFTRNELFPHWSVEVLAEWHWVKVRYIHLTTVYSAVFWKTVFISSLLSFVFQIGTAFYCCGSIVVSECFCLCISPNCLPSLHISESFLFIALSYFPLFLLVGPLHSITPFI